MHMEKSRVFERWAAAVAVVAITAAALAVLMRWGSARWDVPFDYDGDSLLMQSLVQTSLEQPWYLSTPRLGAPHEQAMYDYPCADTLDIVLVKLIGLFERRPAVVFNLFYVLTYPLAALAMLYAARRLALGRIASMAAAVLFAFLPYHALRGQTHLFLSSYFMIPLMTLLLVEIAMGQLPFFQKGESGHMQFRIANGHSARAAIVAALFGATNPYYSYFGLLLLPVAGAVDAWTHRRRQGLFSAAMIGLFVVISVLFNTLPSLLYQYRHGGNPAARQRKTWEAEAYGLKITHLLLPAPAHQSEAVLEFRERIYDPANHQFENENTTAALGAIAAAGFLGLLGRLLVPRPSTRSTVLAQLNIATVLLTTIGGFGAFINLVFAQFRCYNRMSVFIGCFALLAVAGWIDAGLSHLDRRRFTWWLALAVTASLVAFGIWDGATTRIQPQTQAMIERWDSDAEFVHKLEEKLPGDCSIFQLPVVRFPESPVVFDLGYYQSLTGYLHSRRLRWSYGAVRGRPTAAWQADLGRRLENDESRDDALTELTQAGFSAVWVDWSGYSSDQRDALRTKWRRWLGAPVASTPDGRTDCFRLTKQ